MNESAQGAALEGEEIGECCSGIWLLQEHTVFLEVPLDLTVLQLLLRLFPMFAAVSGADFV